MILHRLQNVCKYLWRNSSLLASLVSPLLPCRSPPVKYKHNKLILRLQRVNCYLDLYNWFVLFGRIAGYTYDICLLISSHIIVLKGSFFFKGKYSLEGIWLLMRSGIVLRNGDKVWWQCNKNNVVEWLQISEQKSHILTRMDSIPTLSAALKASVKLRLWKER